MDIQKQVQKLREKYKSVGSLSSDGIVIVVTHQGKCLHVNLETGKPLYPGPGFETACRFIGNKAYVYDGKEYFHINPDGTRWEKD